MFDSPEANAPDLGRIAYERGRNGVINCCPIFCAAMTGETSRKPMRPWRPGICTVCWMPNCSGAASCTCRMAVTEDEIKTSVQQAVTVFMAAYGHSSLTSVQSDWRHASTVSGRAIRAVHRKLDGRGGETTRGIAGAPQSFDGRLLPGHPGLRSKQSRGGS